MLDATYHAWQADTAAGKRSLMIAESRQTVAELNRRARADRIHAGHVAADGEVALVDGGRVSAGDLIVTRRNNRHLVVGRGWVKNGDHWTIVRTDPDGSLTVRRAGRRRVGATVRLAADYVDEHVDLGYATTVHRAQGATVDTAYVLVTPQMTREAYYVAMTRARQTNLAYVATDQPGLETHQLDPDAEVTARSVLVGVLNHVGAEASAHQTAEAEAERYRSIAQLAAEYDTLANHAQRSRWKQAMHHSGMPDGQVDAVLTSDSYGALASLLRRADADGHNPESLLHHAVQRHGPDDADDLAEVLHHRVRLTADQPGGRPIRRTQRRLIVGLIPEATGPMTDEMSQALKERRLLIERRADKLVEDAERNRSRWIRSLCAAPSDPLHRHQWIQHARTLAAYRVRYQITTDRPLGPEPSSIAQRIDAAQARTPMQRAQQTSAAQHARLDRTAPHLPPPTL